ncbi:hypothetical protein [Jiella mangrovi]|uniref:Carboxypeptidase regulatory-like domain-containing protein n=1 Tax=Jiella mangrovi TaxID=2821407 RepID=A0ABS4BGG4_9HYPH|nr:hypothetical protein [Jiella mangrovi]MBP0615843.1 hypothetical protein [Jiella mangrovi]
MINFLYPRVAIFSSTLLFSSFANAEGVFGQLVSMDVLDPEERAKIISRGHHASLYDFAEAESIESEVPISDQSIKICTDKGECKEVVTNNKGYFQFDYIPSGNYEVKTIGPDGQLLSAKIIVKAGERKGVKLITPSAHSNLLK